MKLNNACNEILSQLAHVIDQLTPEEFTIPITILNGATIGQHIRHTLEFFICLEKGCKKGVVNYDKRDHDRSMENDKTKTLQKITDIQSFINTFEETKPILLQVDYSENGKNEISIATNLQRELVYNIEHAVHHMAIIKIGLQAIRPDILLPKDFGVAVSTLRHQEASI